MKKLVMPAKLPPYCFKAVLAELLSNTAVAPTWSNAGQAAWSARFGMKGPRKPVLLGRAGSEQATEQPLLQNGAAS